MQQPAVVLLTFTFDRLSTPFRHPSECCALPEAPAASYDPSVSSMCDMLPYLEPELDARQADLHHTGHVGARVGEGCAAEHGA